MFTEDLDAFLTDFGVCVVLADGSESLGIEDFADVGQVGNDGRAEVIGRQRTVLLRSDVATTLRPGSAITVGGVARTVLDPRAQEDGAFTTVTLR
jgi:hypothetical protein